jgi:starvation-inducible DNA-binding protein
MHKINIGLSEKQRKGVCELLNRDLADAYLLLIKTKKFHWDVIGPQFRTLHKLWEEQYEILTETIDAIAERVRMLGFYPIGSAQGFLENATLKEETQAIPTATAMVEKLVYDHELIIRNLREHIDQCSEEFHDEGTADFLTGLMEGHEEMAWMLRSFIEGEAVQAEDPGKRKEPVGASR